MADLGEFDLAYLDPPYNQHRYSRTTTSGRRWLPGMRRSTTALLASASTSRDPETKSVFNRKREMPLALRDVVRQVQARVVILSYNDESWATLEELV